MYILYPTCFSTGRSSYDHAWKNDPLHSVSLVRGDARGCAREFVRRHVGLIASRFRLLPPPTLCVTALRIVWCRIVSTLATGDPVQSRLLRGVFRSGESFLSAKDPLRGGPTPQVLSRRVPGLHAPDLRGHSGCGRPAESSPSRGKWGRHRGAYDRR